MPREGLNGTIDLFFHRLEVACLGIVGPGDARRGDRNLYEKSLIHELSKILGIPVFRRMELLNRRLDLDESDRFRGDAFPASLGAEIVDGCQQRIPRVGKRVLRRLGRLLFAAA